LLFEKRGRASTCIKSANFISCTGPVNLRARQLFASDKLQCGANTKRKSPAWPGSLMNIFFDQFYFASFAI
jgi:hypothetical protein